MVSDHDRVEGEKSGIVLQGPAGPVWHFSGLTRGVETCSDQRGASIAGVRDSGLEWWPWSW